MLYLGPSFWLFFCKGKDPSTKLFKAEFFMQGN
jgi:hypothetical protein